MNIRYRDHSTTGSAGGLHPHDERSSRSGSTSREWVTSSEEEYGKLCASMDV